MLNIFTYGGADTLAWLFEGIKLLTDTGGEMSAVLRFLFIITTIVVVVEIAFTGRFEPTARLFSFILIFNVALVSTTDVIIVDEIVPANTQIVTNVPSGLAWIASIASTMGKWATDGFENTFSAINVNYAQTTYRNNGMMFASRIMDASTGFQITDPRFAENLSEFNESCVYKGAMVGWYSFTDLANSGDVWTFLNGRLGNGLFTAYNNGTSIAVIGCANAWSLMDTDWPAATNDAFETYGLRFFSGLSPADAKNALMTALPSAYQALAGIAQTQSQIIRQNMMLNSTRHAYTRLAASAGASSVVQDYALAVSEQQQKTTYNTLGALAGRTLPLMRNIFEALIYGMFPIMMFVILLSRKQGDSIMFYVKSVMWLQLWAPLNALLNFFITNYAFQISLAAAKNTAGATALNLMTQHGLSAVNSDMISMAGYLAWTIPILSWSIVSGGGFAASQLAAGVGSIAQSSGSQASGEAARGNINIGNVNAENSRMFQSNNAPNVNNHMGSFTNPDGSTIHAISGGGDFLTTAKNNTGFGAIATSSFQSGVSTTAGHKMEAAHSTARSWLAAQSAIAGAVATHNLGNGTTTTSGEQYSAGASAQSIAAFKELEAAADKAGISRGLDAGTRAQIMAIASASMGQPGALKLINPVDLKATGNFSGTSTAQLAKAWNKAKSYVSSHDISSSVNSAVEGTSKDLAGKTDEDSNKLNKAISGGGEASQKASTTLAAQFNDAQTWARAANTTRGKGWATSANMEGMLRAAVQEKFGAAAGDAMLQAGMRDDAAAIAAILAVANDLGETQGAAIAGVAAAPSNAAVLNANSENMKAIPTMGQVRQAAEQNESGVKKAAYASGAPTSAQTQKGFDATEERANQLLAQFATGAAVGGDKTKQDGGAIDSAADASTNGHVHLGGAAMDGFIEGAGDLLASPGEAYEMYKKAVRGTPKQPDTADSPVLNKSLDDSPKVAEVPPSYDDYPPLNPPK